MTEADILTMTYYHKATITRPQSKKDGVFDVYDEEIVYQDLACAVSFTKTTSPGPTDTVQPIQYSASLFIRPEINIQAGDEVQADVYGRIYHFIAGEGAVYSSHCEVPLLRRDQA